jgi:hypothetical protein
VRSRLFGVGVGGDASLFEGGGGEINQSFDPTQTKDRENMEGTKQLTPPEMHEQ